MVGLLEGNATGFHFYVAILRGHLNELSAALRRARIKSYDKVSLAAIAE
jgi:hypothetical protein